MSNIYKDLKIRRRKFLKTIDSLINERKYYEEIFRDIEINVISNNDNND